jgi:hypothetical protein
MIPADFAALIAQIEAGEFTPSQMEDMVYTMHDAYVDRNSAINEQLPTSLEDVADSMVLARLNTERFDWEEDDAPARCGGFVLTVPNVEGVSLGVAQ